MDELAVDIQGVSQTLLNLMSTWGLKVLGAIALLVIGRIAAGSLRRLVRKGLTRANVDATLVPFVGGLVYWTVIAVVLAAVLGLVGVQTTSLIAVFGAAGLAIGLALQGALSNFAAGVMLLLFRPFHVGNYIEAAGTGGTVEAIGLFTTTLNTIDNVQVFVPNSKVYGDTIKNYAANPQRRIDLSVGISYDDDISTAIKTINQTLKADDRVLADPAAVVAVSELADSSVNLVVRPWCKREDYWDLRFDLNRALKEQLEAAGCSIPYPQRDIHLFQAKG